VLTNHPYHYGLQGVLYPAERAVGHLPPAPRPPIAVREALMDLMTSVQQFGRVPSLFPAEWGQ
jgi:hypothetical protein